MRHCRTVALHRLHAAVDWALHPAAANDPTTGKSELATLTVAGPSRAAGVHYLPTPWRVLDWVHAALPEPSEAWTFLDLGAGKGRALLSAARRPYGRVIGVEFASELAHVARAAVTADCKARRAGAVEVVEADAAAFAPPLTPLVVFLFNPFGPPVIDSVAAGLSASWQLAPRPIVIAYLNPVHHQAFASQPAFARHALAPRLARRFRHLSPYPLHLYATPEAASLLP